VLCNEHGTISVAVKRLISRGKKPQQPNKYGIPREAVLGYPETPYPEYQQKMMAASGR
jgi:hypothetical protein